MSRSVRLVLASLGLFLVLFPLTAARPGQPATLNADEPAYFLMALSLVEDGDLRCDLGDVLRAFDHYQYLPLNNLIVMSPDDWETVYFGKPYIYSVLAAPAAALLGVNGFHAFNMLLVVGMIWMGTVYLRRFNSDAVAALYSSAFFLLSSAFAYVFWIHPEVLNMFSVTACLFLAFHRPGDEGSRSGGSGEPDGPEGEVPAARAAAGRSPLRRLGATLAGPALRPVWSGAVLALGVYNKPMLAALGVPALWLFFRRRRWRGASSWVGGAVLGMAVIVLGSMLLTSRPTAYLGVSRGGINVAEPGVFGESIDKLRRISEARAAQTEGPTSNSFEWLFRIPKPAPSRLLEDATYFLVGRHTGLVAYTPFAVLSVLLFLAFSRGSPTRWAILAALTLVALYFLIWIPWNWHGGGGFIGNRYYVNVYPAFLFLVTAVRPVWLPAVGTGAAGLLLGTVLFSPWGTPVPKASMQAHVRGGLFPHLPLELSLRNKIPGYDSFGFRGVGFLGRSDVFEIFDEPTGAMWTRGATRTEIWIHGSEPLERLLFDVLSWAPDNEIVLELPGVREVLVFENAVESPDNQRRVDLRPSGPTRVRHNYDGTVEYLYRMLVTTRTGRHQGGNMMNVLVKPLFYIGAQLNFVGTDERAPQRAHYRIAWEDCSIPARVDAASVFELPLRVRNDSESTWGARGAYQVNLVYRWLDASGARLEEPRSRINLHHNVRPGETISKLFRIQTPEEPGRYVLVLDAIRRNAALFSRRGGTTCEAPVRVVASTRREPE